ncbi:MAG TPA: carboxylesterase family protein, partial [bacterium]|nr:carboxylesterase family protein [bacterium]
MKKIMIVLLCMSALILSRSLARADGPADCTNIPTDKGKVSGTLKQKAGVCAYKGIPYAKPPVGELRFKAPVEPVAWSETLNAKKYGGECPQYPMGLKPSGTPVGNEDCLYLNVWHPVESASERLPVMVFVHGGGFVMGSGSQEWYEGTNLASRGKVVVVTLNYRLGPFGFMVHPALKDEKGRSGNYGMLDQVAALKWVKKNIAAFGGDPDNITIFGQSAGGASIGLLVVSPMTKGLYNKAIVQSGPVIMMNRTIKSEAPTGLKAAEMLGCKDIATAAACLRKIDALEFIKIVKPVIGLLSDTEIVSGFPFQPVIDGYFYPEAADKLFAAGKYDVKAPILLGGTKDEATIFIAGRKIETEESFLSNLKSDAESIEKTYGVPIDVNMISSLYPVSAYPSPKIAYTDVITDLAFTCPNKILADIISKSGGTPYVYYFTKGLDEKGPLKDWGA